MSAVAAVVPQPTSRRRFLRALGIVAVPGALAACSTDTKPAKPAASRPPVSLTYVYDHTDLPQTIGAWYRWVVDRFAQENPGSRAELQLVKSVQDLLKVSVAGGKPAADTAYLRLFDARELWDGGVIIELTNYVRNHKDLAPSNYFDSANDYRTLGGKLFALPNYINAEMVWVNSRLLKEANLDPKAADLKTWDDLARYNQTLSKRDAAGRYVQLGYPMNSAAWQTMSAWIYANGGEIQDASVNRALFNSPQTQRVLNFWRDMYQRYGNNALWSDDLRQTGVDNFLQEKWAIRDRSFGFARASRATPNYFPSGADSWIINVPKGPDAKGAATTTWVNQFGIPKGVPNPDASFELLRLAGDMQSQVVMHRLAQWEPCMPAYYQSQAYKSELTKDPILQVGVDAFKVGRTYPFFRRYTQATGEPYAPITAAIRGEKDVPAALAEAERLTNQMLQQP